MLRSRSADCADFYHSMPSPPPSQAADAEPLYGQDRAASGSPMAGRRFWSAAADQPGSPACLRPLIPACQQRRDPLHHRPDARRQCPDNDWVLSDPYVSQYHALLSPEGDGLRVIDRGSRNGIFLNGVRVKQGSCSAAAGCNSAGCNCVLAAVSGRRSCLAIAPR